MRVMELQSQLYNHKNLKPISVG